MRTTCSKDPESGRNCIEVRWPFSAKFSFDCHVESAIECTVAQSNEREELARSTCSIAHAQDCEGCCGYCRVRCVASWERLRTPMSIIARSYLKAELVTRREQRIKKHRPILLKALPDVASLLGSKATIKFMPWPGQGIPLPDCCAIHCDIAQQALVEFQSKKVLQIFHLIIVSSERFFRIVS